MHSEQINELASALAKAQGAMGAAKMNKVNPHFKSSFADLASVINAIRKPLADNGLSWSQTLGQRDDATILMTILMHTSGQWIASECFIPRNLKPQEFGSYQTYMRRYSLSAICGIAADEDDDGEATRKGNGGAVVVPTGEVLSEEQCQTLTGALQERGMPIERLMKYVSTVFGDELRDIADIPVELYKQCLAKIQQQGKVAK